jgi:hypothetical protein
MYFFVTILLYFYKVLAIIAVYVIIIYSNKNHITWLRDNQHVVRIYNICNIIQFYSEDLNVIQNYRR